MSTQDAQHGFSKLRVLFWPIHGHELKKLIPMLAIFFLLAFNYNVLRCLKDTLVIAAEGSGAGVIPFIKVWVMFPASIGITYIFLRLSNRLPRESVFYVMLSIFLGYFFLFVFVIYPMRDYIQPHASADYLETVLPIGWKGFVSMYRYWTFTIFYVMAELWGPIILAVLFWGFANQVTKIDEAKRFYGLFGIGISVATIAAGLASILITQLSAAYNLQDTWRLSLTCLIILVLISGLASMAIFRWLNKVALKDPLLAPKGNVVGRKERKKFSMRENLRFLTTSKYVLCIAAMIVCYNIIINLVEVFWKEEVYQYLKETQAQDIPTAYNRFMNEMTTATGILSTLIAVFVSGNSIRKLGWTKTALLTPVLLLITSLGFFGFALLHGRASEFVIALVGVSPLALVVFFGSLQNVLSRSARYTVFDVTKEMSFVPLTNDEKIKAKAAIDGVCNRLGKSSGSVVYEGLLLGISSVAATAPFVAPLILGIIFIWILAVKSLGRQFHTLASGQERKEAEPSPGLVPVPAGEPIPASA
jgi:AAA family ATP:ADP antiporter